MPRAARARKSPCPQPAIAPAPIAEEHAELAERGWVPIVEEHAELAERACASIVEEHAERAERGWVSIVEEHAGRAERGWVSIVEEHAELAERGWVSIVEEHAELAERGWVSIVEEHAERAERGWVSIVEEHAERAERGWVSIVEEHAELAERASRNALRKQEIRAHTPVESVRASRDECPTFGAMRIPGRAALTACTLALAAVLLAACTPAHSDADPTKTPKPTPTPVFTSDADALAAATKVYKKYLAVSDQIAQEGGKGADRLRPYVNSDGLKYEEAEAKRLDAEHAHQIGTTAVTAAKLQSRSSERVSIYACQDVSKVDVVDPSGKSLVDPSRPASIPYIATLEIGSNGQLIVASDKYWDGENICP